MKAIEEILIHKVGLGEDLYPEIEKVLKKVKLKKKELLIREGEVCSFIGLLDTGVLRSYILKDGSQFNIDFYTPSSFVSSYTSFLTQTPSVGFIQALASSELYLIDRSDYIRLIATNPSYYKLGNYISNSLFIRKCKRETSLLMDSAAARYAFLLDLYPGIEQLVPQYHIASYLGIQPESLSRVKSLTYINEKGAS